MKKIVRFNKGWCYWKANERMTAEVELASGQVIIIRQVSNISFDEDGFPTRIESPYTIFVQEKS